MFTSHSTIFYCYCYWLFVENENRHRNLNFFTANKWSAQQWGDKWFRFEVIETSNFPCRAASRKFTEYITTLRERKIQLNRKTRKHVPRPNWASSKKKKWKINNLKVISFDSEPLSLRTRIYAQTFRVIQTRLIQGLNKIPLYN